MKAARFPGDLTAATVVLLAVAAELTLREMYFRLASEIPHLAVVIALWLLFAGLVFWSRRVLNGKWREAIGRLVVVAAGAIWMVVVASPALGWIDFASARNGLFRWAPDFVLLLIAFISLRLTKERWDLVRRAMAVGALLFVASQPVLASWRAPTIYWPPVQAAADQPRLASKSVVVFLLLDELNANAAQPIADALRATGREVREKSIVPVGDGTAKVIPAMFANRSFENAKPCGIYTVCSGNNVLDFSKVVASRHDIDVVGFYEPYCSIRGLRWCARLAPASPVLKANRWWCAAMRRFGWLADRAGKASQIECGDLGGQVWGEFVSDVEQAFWQAPVWREGGFLFAHVPLPHPPGQGGDGSIGEHYFANRDRATALVRNMVERLEQSPGIRFTIVVFSDHPLRSSVWCGASTQYMKKGCPLGPDLLDDKVPLIVAGEVPVGFDRLVTNGEIFSLAAD